MALLARSHQYMSMHFVFSPLLSVLPCSGINFSLSEQCLIIPFTLPKLLVILSCNVHGDQALDGVHSP